MNLLFDLDGTLTDPVLGITRCLAHALVNLGREPPPIAALARFIGPPLRDTFGHLLSTSDPQLVAVAIELYRQRFAEVGMFENAVYPDVEQGLSQLTADGHRLWVVTSKPHLYARRIVQHFRLDPWFAGVYGSELDGSNCDKVDLIRVVLEAERLVPGDTWMIGDRAQDVIGGRSNSTWTVGVLWGYGSAVELGAAEADILVSSMHELSQHLRGLPLAPTP